jgi:hypothetical protein
LKNPCLWIGLLFLAACDSGDIYPKEYTHDAGITVEATFVFENPNVFPNDYPLIFGVFNDEQPTPLTSVRIIKPKNNNPVNVSIENISAEATSIRLCLTNLGRQPVFVLFEMKIDKNNTDNIVIPESKIDLMTYDRIQKLIFEQYTCVACHQGTVGAGNLLLTAERSYNDLVNKASHKFPNKNRVSPFEINNSFLLDVVTDNTLELTQPHTSFITRNDDFTLLEEWIKNGAK